MKQQQGGFAYLAVLFLMAVAAVAVAGQGAFSAVDGEREREEDLLFVGGQFRQAIASYYESTPGPVKLYPDSLEDLVLDRRFEPSRHHLRRIYIDPMTGQGRWGEVRAPEGGVMGVFSLSTRRPMKQVAFNGRDYDFAGKKNYGEWIFLYQGGQTRFVPAKMLSVPAQ